MRFNLSSAVDVPLAEQAEAFNGAFEGYVVALPIFDATTLAQMISAADIDPNLSRLLRDETGAIASFGYINHTETISRLASMGTLASARRQGAANFLLSHLIDEAKSRGDTLLTLEVFEQNPPAVTLYEKLGFKKVMRLFGWRRNIGPIAGGPALEEIAVSDVANIRSPRRYPDIPWQISTAAMLRAPNSRAYRFSNTAAVISEQANSSVRLLGLFWPDPDDWAAPRTLLAGLLRRFRGRDFFARQICPESWSTEIFKPLGFEREPLNQFLMHLGL